MRNPVVFLSLASVCLAYAGTGHAQSLAEIAKKEKARRAQVSKKNGEVVVVGEHDLRNAGGSTFTAVEVTGAPARAERPSIAPGPPPVNPNRATAPPKTAQSTPPGPSTPTAAKTELGKGWSKNNEKPPSGRGWNPRRKEILESMGRTVNPIHPRTVQERDRLNGRYP